MGEDDDRKDTKRQKLQSEQRSAYEEDMARINAALNEQQPHQPSASAADDVDNEEEKNENTSGDTQQEQQQQQGGQGSDDEEGGNWLKNFTPHHTRVGENFQVTDLPSPSHSSTSAAVIVPKQ
jgi:hypothetical protein